MRIRNLSIPRMIGRFAVGPKVVWLTPGVSANVSAIVRPFDLSSSSPDKTLHACVTSVVLVPRGEDSMVKASSSDTCSFFASSCAKTTDEARMMGMDKIFIIVVCFDRRMVVQMDEIIFSQI